MRVRSERREPASIRRENAAALLTKDRAAGRSAIRWRTAFLLQETNSATGATHTLRVSGSHAADPIRDGTAASQNHRRAPRQ